MGAKVDLRKTRLLRRLTLGSSVGTWMGLGRANQARRSAPFQGKRSDTTIERAIWHGFNEQDQEVKEDILVHSPNRSQEPPCAEQGILGGVDRARQVVQWSGAASRSQPQEILGASKNR